MALFIVTVKMATNPHHDPKNKVTGGCPLTSGQTLCTDNTGAHHSALVGVFDTSEEVRSHFVDMGYHVTRIESV